MDRRHEAGRATVSEGDEDRPTFAMPRPGKTLTALTTSALALPGIAGSARADAPIERASASTSFSYYREDDVENKRLFSTSTAERYEVFTKQLRIDFPTSERTDVGIDYLFEDMSGASPWFVQQEGGRFVQFMSGATIEDQRHDLNIDLDYYMDSGKDTVSAGFSVEKDYESWHFGMANERQFNDKNTTMNVAWSWSFDEIEPTDGGAAGGFNRVKSDHKWSVDLFAGLTQIVSRASVAQVTVNYKHSDGFLDDPYKQIAYIGGAAANLPDARPHDKDQVSVMARYRHHFEDVEGTLQLDYRFYFDSWGVTSHTAELGWSQTFADIVRIAPSFRYYSQSQADFYEPMVAAALTGGSTPIERSSDFRLSPYGALAARLKLEVDLEDCLAYEVDGTLGDYGFSEGLDLILGLSYERYFSDGHLGLTTVGEFEQSPGLVSFHVGAFTITGSF